MVDDASKKHPFPCPTTFRTALSFYLDISSLPTTQLLKELSQYATDEDEKKLLQLMGTASEEGKVISFYKKRLPCNYLIFFIKF